VGCGTPEKEGPKPLPPQIAATKHLSFPLYPPGGSGARRSTTWVMVDRWPRNECYVATTCVLLVIIIIVSCLFITK
jgi:hypothetical protein